MAVKMRKTLVIGIGGTGVKSLLHMKKEFCDYFESGVPPIVRLIGIDTDVPSFDVADSMGNPVELAGNEWVYASVRDPVAVLNEFDEIRREFPEGMVRLRSLLAGAGQVRACGRLAVLANATPIIKQIQDAYASVVGAATKDAILGSTEFDLSDDPYVTVYIVCSLAGGTGSGAFLDLGYICRGILGNNDRIIGMFLLPSVFSSYPATDYVEGNTYAALRELDFLLDRASTTATDIVDYRRGFTVDWGKHQPYNQVYLVDNRNEKGVRFNNLDQMLRFIGRALYVNTNVVAAQNDDIMDNIAGHQATEEPWNNKYPHYAGIGAAAIELPIEKIVQLSSYKKVSQLIHEGFLTSDKARVDQDVTEFTRDIRIAEYDADNVIDALHPPSEVYAPDELREAWQLSNPATAIPDWRDRETRAMAEKYKRSAEARYGPKLEDAKRKISERIREATASRAGGIDYMRAFARSLASRLRADRQAMAQEKADEEAKLADTRNEYPSDEQIGRACQGVFIRPKIEKLLARFSSMMNRESEHLMEITRREFAIDLFAELAKDTERHLEQLETINRRLEAAASIVSQRIQEYQGLKGVNSFTKYLDEDCLDDEIARLNEQVHVESVLDALREAGESPLAWNGPDWDEEKIADRLHAIAIKRYSELSEKGMDQVLRNLGRKDAMRLKKYLRDFLIERATPLWRPSAVVDREGLTRIFVFGVQNEVDNIFGEGEDQVDPGAYGIDQRRCKFAFTGNKHSITAFQYKLRIPAYLLEGVDDFKQDYDGREPRSDFTHHTRKMWADSPAVLGDVFPERHAGTEEQAMYWAVSFAEPFSLVRYKGSGHYSIRSEKLGRKVDDYWVKLGQGRKNAFDAFVSGEHCQELIAEVKEKVDTIVAEHGQKAISESLHAYALELAQQVEGEGVSSDIKDLVEEELHAIERLVKRISTIS